ncbi:hypothetical protein SODALDRAFT_82466 [Sodiomyces alkalinus F11]|uniref:Uncharacterized protein n=1 Tax=Sodiomyces alkalinus (strain CBS 110278 / VKM F-3762 / F11) TaxID=1314773 RepID=A0A3N2PJR4_SODAK|nr:hypothetical protein SODALDRAFT_82466 [Sodiomyces alkalinus F11]ROT34670.1 hypothetical protein SODALDRAFT_82466 [Sodiomyces alkalinus F11]
MISRAANPRNICIQCQLRFPNKFRRPWTVRPSEAAPILPFSRPFSRHYSSPPAWERLHEAGASHEAVREASRDNKNEDVAAFDHASHKETHDEPSPTDASSNPEGGLPEASHSRSRPSDKKNKRKTSNDNKSKVHRGRVGLRRVTLSPEELGVEMLGEKAHTIIMRDDQRPDRSRLVEEIPLPEDGTSPDLAAELKESIEASRDTASLEEAYQNIEELRPENSLLPRNEFGALLETLAGGFTKSQLTYYLSTKTKARSSSSSKTPGSALASRETRSWMARPVVFRPLEEIELPSKPGKDRVAYSLMSRAWGLDVWERVEGLNEIVVSFTDSAWAYLQARHRDGDLIADIGQGFIQPGESVTGSPATKELRIMARKPAGQAILDHIEDFLESAAEENLTLFPRQTKLPVANITESFIRKLGSLTQTALSLDSSGILRVLSWNTTGDRNVADDQNAWESKAHVIWRLLYTAFLSVPSTAVVDPSFVPRRTRTFASQRRASSKNKDPLQVRLAPAVGDQERWTWRHRLQSWSRWILPLGRDTADPKPRYRYRFGRRRDLVKGTPQAPLSVIRAAPTMLFLPSNKEADVIDDDTDDTLSSWSPPEETTSVTFGHLLFPHGQGVFPLARALSLSPSQGVLTSSETDSRAPTRMFSPIVPPPTGLASLDSLATTDVPATTTLVLRFAVGVDRDKPFLEIAKDSVRLRPSSVPSYLLEVHLAVPDQLPLDGRLTWENSPEKHVHVILSREQHDVTLPDRPVDLRVYRSSISRLPNPDSIPAIRRFVDASLFDLDQGMLRTPAFMHIPADELAGLPMMSNSLSSAPERGEPAAGKRQRSQNAQTSEDPSGPVDETFAFIGLEVRRSVTLHYEGHQLRYTNIEAGLHGGRRTELSLHMLPPAEGKKPGTLYQRRYIDLATRLAGDQLFLWLGEKPRHVHGA